MGKHKTITIDLSDEFETEDLIDELENRGVRMIESDRERLLKFALSLKSISPIQFKELNPKRGKYVEVKASTMNDEMKIECFMNNMGKRSLTEIENFFK